MRVYVESNFVLELVLKQEEFDAAEALLRFGEAGKISLAIPAYSLVEPFHTLERDRRVRRRLRDELESQVQQMARSSTLSDIRESSNKLLLALANKADSDLREHLAVVHRILQCASTLPLDEQVGQAALVRELIDLKLPDAIVFSSIEASLKQDHANDSLFTTRDAKGFLQPTTKDVLNSLRCTVVPTFKDALGFLKAKGVAP